MDRSPVCPATFQITTPTALQASTGLPADDPVDVDLPEGCPAAWVSNSENRLVHTSPTTPERLHLEKACSLAAVVGLEHVHERSTNTPAVPLRADRQHLDLGRLGEVPPP